MQQQENVGNVEAGTQGGKEIRVAASDKALSVFERRGFAFPHHEEQAKKINSFCAALWTELDSIAVPPGNSEAGRLIAMAKTEVEQAAMLATKALTRFSPSAHTPAKVN